MNKMPDFMEFTVYALIWGFKEELGRTTEMGMHNRALKRGEPMEEKHRNGGV